MVEIFIIVVKVIWTNFYLNIIIIHVAELNPDECRDLIEVYNNVYFTTNFMDLELYMKMLPGCDGII